MIMTEAIAGDDSSGPVAAMLAVDEHRGGRRFDDGKRADDLVIGGAAEALEGNIGVSDAVGKSSGAFFG